MSRGTTWVRAVDESWYAEPIFRGVTERGNRWFIVFDEDDDPEFVLETTHGAEDVNRLLPKWCVRNQKFNRGRISHRVFSGINEEFLLNPAISFRLLGTKRIPVPQEYDTKRQPISTITGTEGTFYDFEVKRSR